MSGEKPHKQEIQKHNETREVPLILLSVIGLGRIFYLKRRFDNLSYITKSQISLLTKKFFLQYDSM